MPNCPHCKAEVQLNWKACPACGNRVENDQGPSLDATDSAAEEVHHSQAVDRTIRVGHQASQMASFPRAIKLGFQNYFNFRRRATRAEYWWWQLFVTVVYVALALITVLLNYGMLLAEAASLLLVFPTLSLNTRRLHDFNISGWVQVVFPAWWFGFKSSDKGPNNYGQVPRHPVNVTSETQFWAADFPPFYFLWLAILFSSTGLLLVNQSRIFRVVDSSQTLDVFLVTVAVTIVLLPFGGVVADRVHRKRLLQLCQLGFAAVALYFAISINTEMLRWHYVGSGLLGVISAFYLPAKLAIIPQLVGRGRAAAAIAVAALGSSMGAVSMGAVTVALSPVVGELEGYAGVGYNSLLLFTAVGLSILALAAITSLRSSLPVGPRATTALTSDIGTGIRFIWNNKPLPLLLTTLVLFQVAYGVSIHLVTWEVYENSLSPMAVAVSSVVRSMGYLGGILIIAGLLAVLPEGKRGLVFLSAGLLTGLGLLLLTAAISNLPATLIIIVFTALGAGSCFTLATVLAMGLTESLYHGRVASVLMICSVLPAALAPKVASALINSVDELALVVIGMPLILFSLVLFLTPIGRRLRQIR